MARPLRIEKAGGWYYATARGNERKSIFRDDRDGRHFLELLEEMAERPALAAVIAAVEQVKGRNWAEFRDEYGDPGRDMALYLGRRWRSSKLTHPPLTETDPPVQHSPFQVAACNQAAKASRLPSPQWVRKNEQKWVNFRERQRGRRLGGMKLAELAKVVGLRNYGVVATNAKRYELRLARNREEKARMKQVLELLNCEM